ncbi:MULTISPECIES: MMPL family transporter [unclassified Frankia]|uniref:MMPL family transporter n=1 Tax=unclassified Frankia TaxID=2632575 RepID=UPI002025773D
MLRIAGLALTLGALIGLGVGIDYALFIITRHRAGLKAGRSDTNTARTMAPPSFRHSSRAAATSPRTVNEPPGGFQRNRS